MKKVFLIFGVVLCACSAKHDDNKQTLARVYDEYLYLSDIQGVMPQNVSGKDSADIASEYVNNWINQQLILVQAEKNLSDEEKDFSRQLEEYKNSLTVFKYESKLISQRLDTIVSDEEIARYYELHKDNFVLKENIVKVIYVKIPKGVSAATVRNLIRSGSPQDMKKLQDFCHKYAVNYYLDDQNWLLFNDILKEIPISTYNQEEYLKNNRFIEIQDSAFTYLMNIKGFMIKEGVSPLSFEQSNIRDMIINKRKLALIENMRKDIYDNALRKKDFEVFKN
ncbi:MAG TPA: hypothetical protein PKL96_04055 [Bacteroidales bacterium]|nr:hypothetical protein [Bacteroidales bacterium]HPS26674.1 hypothetical protein [Bacteroidales bacterium]